MAAMKFGRGQPPADASPANASPANASPANAYRVHEPPILTPDASPTRLWPGAAHSRSIGHAPDMPAKPLPEAVPGQFSETKSRVRLGSAPTTAADVLLGLAYDPDVTVRAAVAMNPASSAQVDQLLAADKDERVRTLLARRLATLIPTLPGADRDRLRDQALATLTGLVEDEAVRVRNAIADVLKDMPDAPHQLILRLSRDAAREVSEPVIRLSPLLTSADLMALLHAPRNAWAATAVARRPMLPEPVCDAVAATADVEAIAAMLENPSAAIRESTLDQLIAQAAQHQTWHAPLVRRPVLSVRAMHTLSDMVATQLLEELSERADLLPAVAVDLRRRLEIRLKPATRPHREELDANAAMLEARRLMDAGRLTEVALLTVIQRGEMRLATAMLATAAEVPVAVVERAATLRSAKGLTSLVWQAGFSMRVAGPVQTLLARLSPGSALRATPGDGFPLALEEMRWQIDFLSNMGR
jgi:uncharacterized protein (DUF2336 family)